MKQINKANILNEYDCGCLIVSEFKGGAGFKFIEWCELHKSAPKLKVEIDRLNRVISAMRILTGSPHAQIEFCKVHGIQVDEHSISGWRKAILGWAGATTDEKYKAIIRP